MTEWLLDTLLWTGVLIALVLLVRRPVARLLGPQSAYALWAIPALRLILPPIELPSWLAPVPTTGKPSIEPVIGMLDPDTPVATTTLTLSDGLTGSSAAAPDSPVLNTPFVWLEAGVLLELAIAVWLIGAAAFLYMRFRAYFCLRNEFLAAAREVGKVGSIRLIETPATSSPLAFGVIDKVIALPPGFMAQHDRLARDLALAHELAHHRGFDLAINMIVQPLFALHWFNPLCRYGWLALRRDQEAACDARVVAQQAPAQRARYASLIASFAAGPNVALAAPMACPVLGEKSIIHRLRSLSMANPSANRRIFGRALLSTALIALPLTATVSYAEETAQETTPVPPAPPTPPESVPSLTPEPVEPPAPPAVGTTIVTVDPDTGETREVKADDDVTVIVNVDHDEDGRRETRRETVRIINRGNFSSREEIARAQAEAQVEAQVEAAMAEMRADVAEAEAAVADISSRVEHSLATIEFTRNGGDRTVVKMECNSSGNDIATSSTAEDGTTTVMLCKSEIMAHALIGLKQARKAIARNSG
ncbi:MAG: M56 family metallopeptidase, partial [Pseudomonadota bacterium]